MDVAVRSNIPEWSRWVTLAEDDKHMLVAYWRIKDRMRAWEQYQMEKEMERQRNQR